VHAARLWAVMCYNMRRILYITFMLTFGICNSFGQQIKNFKTEEYLEKYYPLDIIKSVEMENWKGKHPLSKNQILQFTKDLKTYSCAGNYAKTKPGHFWCNITFQDGTHLYFYSNSSSEIIISTGPVNDYTFKTKKKVNFENY